MLKPVQVFLAAAVPIRKGQAHDTEFQGVLAGLPGAPGWLCSAGYAWCREPHCWATEPRIILPGPDKSGAIRAVEVAGAGGPSVSPHCQASGSSHASC